MKAALDPQARRALRALFELAELDVPADAGLLGRALGLPAAKAALVLLELEARGLVDAGKARLTMPGLASAARIGALHLANEPWFSEWKARAAADRLSSAG